MSLSDHFVPKWLNYLVKSHYAPSNKKWLWYFSLNDLECCSYLKMLFRHNVIDKLQNKLCTDVKNVAFWCRYLPIFSDSRNSTIARIKMSCFPTLLKVPKYKPYKHDAILAQMSKYGKTWISRISWILPKIIHQSKLQ